MAKSVYMIGVDPTEIPWLHALIWLLRDPDPAIPELTRQALEFARRLSPDVIGVHVEPGDHQQAALLQEDWERYVDEPYRAAGLHQAMYIVPILAAVLAVVLFAASRTVTKDVGRLQAWMKVQTEV